MPDITQNWDGVTAPAIPSGWSSAGNYATSTSQHKSGTNSLTNTVSNTQGFIGPTAQDSYGGNVIVSANLLWVSSGGTSIGFGARGSAALEAGDGYLVNVQQDGASSNGVEIYSKVGGAYSSIGPGGAPAFATAFGDNIWYNFALKLNGSAISLRVQRASDNLYLHSDGTWGSAADCISVTNTAVAAATGYAWVRYFGAANCAFLDDFSVTNAVAGDPQATTYTVTNPGSMSGAAGANSGDFSVVPNGYLQAGDNLVVTVTDDLSQTVASLTFAPNATTTPTAQTFYYNPTAAGTRTLTFTHTYSGSPSISDPSAATYTASAGGAIPLADSAAITYTPGNVRLDASHRSHLTVNGCGFKVAFTGASLKLRIDVQTYKAQSVALANWMTFLVSVNGGAWAQITMTDPANSNIALVTLTSGLGSGPNEIEVVCFTPEIDTYTPKQDCIVTHLCLAGSGNVLSAITSSSTYATLRPRKIMVFGDSITNGYKALDADGTVTPIANSAGYPLTAWWQVCAAAMDAEVGVVGYSGQGWDNTYSSWAPVFTTTFGNYVVGSARTFPNDLYALVVHQGTNDTGDITSTVQSWLATARTAVGSSCWIILAVPFTYGTHASQLTAAVSAYQSANPTDTKIAVVDVTDVLKVLTNGGVQNRNTIDGTHPLSAAHAQYGAAVGGKAMAAIGGTPLTLSISADGSNHPVLTWTASPGAAHYLVLRSSTAQGAPTLVAVVTAPTLTYTDTSVTGGTQFYAIIATTG